MNTKVKVAFVKLIVDASYVTSTIDEIESSFDFLQNTKNDLSPLQKETIKLMSLNKAHIIFFHDQI